MATRFYPEFGTTPLVTPTSLGGTWVQDTVAFNTYTLSTGTPNNTTLTNLTVTNGSSASAEFICRARFVSWPLAAQTISGNISGQFQASESNANNNAHIAIALRVINAAGTIVATLLAPSASDNTAAAPPELTTTLTNRQVQDAAEATSFAVTSYACAAGDRIVLEIGVREVRNTGTEVIRVGTNASTGDLAVDNTTTLTTRRPWVEFANTLTFQPNVASAAGSNTVANFVGAALTVIEGQAQSAGAVTTADFVGFAATIVDAVAESLTNVGTALAVSGFIAVSIGASVVDARGVGPTATNTGRRFPTVAATASRIGGEFNWQDPNNALAPTAFATVQVNGVGSDYLVLKTFDLATVPDSATIVGLTVKVRALSVFSHDLKVQLQNESGALVGSAKTLTLTGSLADCVYGSTSDLWGATLTPAILKDADFGIRIWTEYAGGFDGFTVDYATIEVEYSTTVNGVGSSVGSAGGSRAFSRAPTPTSSGPLEPWLGANVDRAGAEFWETPASVQVNTVGTAYGTATAGLDYLVCSDFRIDDTVPDGATISGVTVKIEAYSLATESLVVQLQGADGSLIGSSSSVNILGDFQEYVLGGPANLWGAALTSAVVKDSDFGVRLWIDGAVSEVAIRLVSINVEYTTVTIVSGVASAAGIANNGLAEPGRGAWYNTLTLLGNTGRIHPSLGQNVTRTTGHTDWGSPQGIEDNNQFASICSFTVATGSNYLKATNFAALQTLLPTAGTVKGIKLHLISAFADTPEIVYAHLIDGTGAQISIRKQVTVDNAGSVFDFSIGGPTDTWNAFPSLDTIKDVGFGVRVYFETANNAVTIYTLALEVTYSTAIEGVGQCNDAGTIDNTPIGVGRAPTPTSTGPIWPYTDESVARGSGIAWTSLGNLHPIFHGSNVFCIGPTSAGSAYLVAKNFDSPGVPAGATVKGVTVTFFYVGEADGAGETFFAQLQDDTGALVGTSKSFSKTGFPATIDTLGGIVDLWGASLTPAIVNSPNFGVRLWVETANAYVSIDSIVVNIEYEVPPSGVASAAGTSTANAVDGSFAGSVRPALTSPYTRTGPLGTPFLDMYGQFARVAAGEAIADASGTSIVNGVGASIAGAIAQSFGTSPVDGVSALSIGGAGQSVGTSTATFVGAAQSVATAASVGTSTVQATGASQRAGDAASVGTSVVDGKSNALKPAVGDNCAGTSTAQFVGARIVASRADAAGTVLVANAVSVSLFGGRAESVGLSTVQAQSFNIAPMQAASAGLSVIDGRSAATKRSDAAAAGTVLTANFVADARFNGRADSVGISTVQATSAASKASRADSAGVSVCGFVSQSINASVGNAAGLSVVDGLSQAGTPGVINSVGTSVVDGRSAANQPRAFDSQGVSVVDGRSAAVKASVAASAGLASPVDAAGRSTFAGVAASAGTCLPQAVSAATKASVAASAGAGVATGQSQVLFNGVAQSAGTCTATFVGAQRIAAVGNAAGTSTVLAFTGSGGQSVGTSTATFVGRSTNASVAASAGIGTATGVSGIGLNAVANSAGTSTATFVGVARASGVAESAGVGTADGVSAVAIGAVANSSGFCIAEAYSVIVIAGHVAHSAGTSTANFVGTAGGEIPVSPGTACSDIHVKYLAEAGIKCEALLTAGIKVKVLSVGEVGMDARITYDIDVKDLVSHDGVIVSGCGCYNG